MARVNITDLKKEYGDIVATNDISLEIPDGELVVFVGPSGCGKTTTLRSIAGLESPTGGTIEFDSTDVTDQPPQRRDISMVFQNLALYPHMTAYDNIAFPLHAEDGHSDDEIDEAVHDIARIVDCEQFLEKRVVSLSGGQQQRVALARALVRRPEVFLMDEPFSDLDELLKRQLRAEVVRLQQKFGVTMVHVTHDQEEAMTMGDRLVVMNDGEIAQVGGPDTVFSEPRNLFVANFIGSPQINQFTCSVANHENGVALEADDVTFEVSSDLAAAVEERTGERVTLCVRPQHLSWTEDTTDDDLAIPVTVEVIEKIGTEDTIRCRTESGHEVTAVLESGMLSEGQRGALVTSEANVHLFDGTDESARRLN